MKLKESTFAIIAEKKDSISHKWFAENLIKGQKCTIWEKGNVYEFNQGNYHRSWEGIKRVSSFMFPIYTESEFEALLKAEQENEKRIEPKSILRPLWKQGGVKDVYMASPEQITPLTATDYPNIEVKQITITYNLALEYIAERLNVGKGIIKIEMP